MVQVIAKEGEFPSDLASLYNTYLELLMSSQVRQNQTNKFNMNGEQYSGDINVLEELALKVRLTEPHTGKILASELARWLSDGYGSKTTRNMSQYGLSQFTSRVSGILVNVGSDQYSFVHKSFEEYLAARSS